ncbi:MAG: hypothetical protein JW902_09660 [Syntrophaceae bacterium]|nr:hypothetical protein [Syntrophaceae bacterium]
MAVSDKIKYRNIDELYLDPLNPRLGRHRINANTNQNTLLEYMQEQVLEELALSFITGSGFWVQEALLVTLERYLDSDVLVVIEGNRRLAALKLLKMANEREINDSRWISIAEEAREKGHDVLEKLFNQIPCISVDSRNDVDEFLGFRHVSGIKQWKPAEKARFIDRLVVGKNQSFNHISKSIGSNASTVKRNFIAYRVAIQMEDIIEDLPCDALENRFSLLYSAIQNPFVQDFIGLNMSSLDEATRSPIAAEKQLDFKFAMECLFGSKSKEPLVTDTRQITKFGAILNNEDAISYVRKSATPNLENAFLIAGGPKEEVVSTLREISSSIRSILGKVGIYKRDRNVDEAVEDIAKVVAVLLDHFPKHRSHFSDQENDRGNE